MTYDNCPKCNAPSNVGWNKWTCGNEYVGGTYHRTTLCKLNEAIKNYLEKKSKVNLEKLKETML